MLVFSHAINDAKRVVFEDGDFEKVLKKPAPVENEPETEYPGNEVRNIPQPLPENRLEEPRELTAHQCGAGMDEAIGVVVLDKPGPGNASHFYAILSSGTQPPIHIHFQEGPVAEVGPNGISCEALLAIVKDRLDGFQAGDYACEENAIALDGVERALAAMHFRTGARAGAGVEGTSQPDPDGSETTEEGPTTEEEKPAAE